MDQRDRLTQLYHAALARRPGDRAAFLAEACAGDLALQREVESLLRVGSQAGTFLEMPAGELAAAGASSMVGQQLGSYRILGALGAGGMGEVYRARDSKLGREVAIKLLPSLFTADPNRRARFAREARLLATLNHPHIGAIYGLEDLEGQTALVLELVEGPTLAARLERGPLPVGEALAIARQIADALDAAHQKNIIHRDLKPANIVLRGGTSGDPQVKVLDFGLATTGIGEHATDPEQISMTAQRTEAGRVLGTPAYMSPEQARGQVVDKRADVWAFGCVLFEMLSGQRPFGGDTVTDTLARILEHEPTWTAVPAETPGSIQTLLRRCLRKDPEKRLHDIADARIEIDDGQSAPSSAARAAADLAPVVTRHQRRERLAWITTALLGVALLATVSVAVIQIRRAKPPADVIEFTIDPPENWRFNTDSSGDAAFYAVAPDGQHLVAVAHSGAASILWVRPIAKPMWRRLPGTEGAGWPFWSPDGQFIGFFANNELKTVRVSGGLPVVLCPAPAFYGNSGAWSRADVILFADVAGLHKILASGGIPTAVTALAKSETGHLWPSFLPDGDHFLYLAQRPGANELRVGSLTSTNTTSLGLFESNAVYAEGRLIFVQGDTLMAQSFDTTTRERKGDPVMVANRTAVVPPMQRGIFALSATVLAYSSTGRLPSQLTWIDRKGKTLSTTGEPGFYINVDLSPDDLHVAVSQQTEQPGAKSNVDIRVLDLTRAGTARRLTDDPAPEFDPMWSPTGDNVTFDSNRAGRKMALYARRSDGSGQDELLWQSENALVKPDWSRDGNFLGYTEIAPGTQGNLWTLSLSGERKATIFLETSHHETSGTFSPDGRWIAYESNESGQDEVYVRPFPKRPGLFKISLRGGRAPRWRGDGRELYFLTPDGTLMVARIDTRSTFAASVPEPLFNTGLTTAGTFHPYAVAKDGQRFLIPVQTEASGSSPITVVLNWAATLAK